MLNGLDLFSGIGGITIALKKWVRPIAYCEIDNYCKGILLSRMVRRILPIAPVWDDIRTLHAKQFTGKCDIMYGGFPCQDISFAGRGKGLAGERSGLFFEIMRLAKEIKPMFLFLENVPAITCRGGITVVRTLTEMGYDCRWCVISAQSIGALHRRERWFLLAYANGEKRPRLSSREGTKEPSPSSVCQYDVSDTAGLRCDEGASEGIHPERETIEHEESCDDSSEVLNYWEDIESDMGRTLDGFSSWMDKNRMTVKSHKCILAYVKESGIKNDRIEILRTLRNTLSEEILRESTGGFGGISAKKVLLTYLLQLEKESTGSHDMAYTSEKVKEGILRSVWFEEKFARSSHRSRHSKQYDRECPNTLQALSLFLAQDSEEAWYRYRWENAPSVLSQWQTGWSDGIGCGISHHIPFRKDRIKALGNSVVPSQAKEAFKILMGIK